VTKHDLRVDWATHDAAKYACENWHYSRVMPVGKLVKVGAWEKNVFVGVVLFGRGANHNMPKPYGLRQDECVELVRIALRQHSVPVSRIVALSMKFLKKSNPKLRLVVSYADLDQNHHGGIYQAGNWIYEGVFNAGNRQGFLIKGRLRHNKSVHSMGVKQSIEAVKKHIDPNAREIFTKGKHKYLMPLDQQMRQAVSSRSKPYPKRANASEGEESSRSASSREKGGASPTLTLQHTEAM